MTTPYPDWPWFRVKAALEERGTSLTAVARGLGLSADAALNVKIIPNPKVQAAIAAAIGLSPLAIWPTRYGADGQPVRRTEWLKARGRDYSGRKLPEAGGGSSEGEEGDG